MLLNKLGRAPGRERVREKCMISYNRMSASAGEARGLSAAAPRLYNNTLSKKQQSDSNRQNLFAKRLKKGIDRNN